MSMSLPPNAEARIREKVANGLYISADKAIETALMLLDEWDRLQHVQETLIEAGQQIREGRVVEWTPEPRRQIRRDAEAMARQGIPPDPDVCP